MYKYRIAHFQNIKSFEAGSNEDYLQQLEEQQERRKKLLSRLKAAAMGAAGVGSIIGGASIYLDGRKQYKNLVNNVNARNSYTANALDNLLGRGFRSSGKRMLGGGLALGGIYLLGRAGKKLIGREGSLYDDQYDEYDTTQQ